MSNISQIESTIIELLHKKDQKAISLLYKHYSAPLYGIILRTVKEEKTAEEVLQNVFLKVWKNASSYDENKGRLYTWLLNITRNASIDMLRSAKFTNTNKSIPIDDSVYNDRKWATEEKAEESGAKELIGSLDPIYKEVLDLVFLQGYTHQEAAKKLDIPLGTLKSRIRNAIKSIRKNLDKETIMKLLMLTALIGIIILSIL